VERIPRRVCLDSVSMERLSNIESGRRHEIPIGCN
jgi:hypothetical protein